MSNGFIVPGSTYLPPGGQPGGQSGTPGGGSGGGTILIPFQPSGPAGGDPPGYGSTFSPGLNVTDPGTIYSTGFVGGTSTAGDNVQDPVTDYAGIFKKWGIPVVVVIAALLLIRRK